MSLRELEALRAAIAASLANIEAMIARERERESAATTELVALDDAVRVFGSKRKAREWFNRAERAGFRVLRNGHAIAMERDEWTRALEALASKRPSKPSKPADEGPAAALGRVATPRARAA